MDVQRQRRLGRSGVRVSALGLGTAPIGNLYTAVPEQEAAETVRRALAAGLTYLDTAPHYGLGVAEQRLGAVLAQIPRETFTLSTKVGRLLRPLDEGEEVDGQGFVEVPRLKRVWDFTRDGIRASLEESLERLGLERVDVLYLHDPDDHEREVYETGYPALAELRDQGLVGAIGAGMNQAEMLARFVRDLDLDVVLLAGRYTLLDQRGLAELLPLCERRGTSVVIGGVYNSGLLADPRPGATYDYAPAAPGLVERALRIQQVCARHGVPLRAAAVQFPFGHPAVASVLVGARSTEQVADAVAMAGFPIPDELWDELQETGLLPEHVPVPRAERSVR